MEDSNADKHFNVNSCSPNVSVGDHPEDHPMADRRIRYADRGVTLSHVAVAANVSVQTASNALNAPDRLAPGTLKRTLAAIESLGYKPNRVARALRNQSSRLIAVKVEAARSDRAAPLLDQFLHALSSCAADVGFHLILCQADDDRSELAAYQELLQTTAVDAVILSSTHRGDPRIAWLRERGVAFATFGRSWDGDEDLAWVDIDGKAGIESVMGHLVEQGHRRIAFLGWPNDSDVGLDRKQGWLAACRRHGLPTQHLAVESADDFDYGRSAALRLLSRQSPPSAVVCTSDTLALGAMRAMSESGLIPGVDIAVTGFDASPAAALTTPGLTTVRQPLDEVASELINHVEAELSGNPISPRHSLLTPTLVTRESTARQIPVHLTDPPHHRRSHR